MPPSPTPPEGARAHPVPPPADPCRESLPHALTFFLTVAQRRAVLRTLRALHRSREPALLRALGLEPPRS